ncbi:MAG: TM1812 family CRISPR-associated protein [Gammaproteobacteria bacterium]|nr:TM1812 family CRISPR-associated protein [Gammaproteobacteria bacterium]
MTGGPRDGLDAPRRHLLLTVLGTSTNASIYSLRGREREAELAPLALVHLLPAAMRPDKVLALCTREAKLRTFPLLKRSLGSACDLDFVEVPTGDSQDDIGIFLEKVTDAIPEGTDLTVDVTHGFRHFAFLTFSAVLYLCELHGVRVRGAYYGLFRETGPSPFLDLRPLLELPRWIHALQVLRETGSALPMARIVSRDASSGNAARDIARDLSGLSESYLAGLPLEAGRYASDVKIRNRSMRKLLGDRLPLARDLTKRLVRTLEPLALQPAGGQGWKQKVVLSRDELNRQAKMIDELLRRKNYAVAFGLLNEWTVSWISLVRGKEDVWLDYHQSRRAAAGVLGAMAAVAKDPELGEALTEDQIKLAEYWDKLSVLRNAYAHHGMRAQVLVGEKDVDRTRNEVKEYWRHLKLLPDVSLSLGHSPGKRVLVSPMGKRPGVLFSAVHAACAGHARSASLCLVICSSETEGTIAPTLRRADYAGDWNPLVLEDAFAGGARQIDHVAKEGKQHLLGAEEVIVNVTGGTTLMGLAADRLASEARQLACPVVRRFGLIDRRSPREQETDPYQVGEPFWLDERGEDAERD